MKTKFHDDFKHNYQLLVKRVKDPRKLTKELSKFVTLLWAKKPLPEQYIINRLLSKGSGWFECYLYCDKKYCIIVHYKVAETYILFTQIGTPQMLTDAQSMH